MVSMLAIICQGPKIIPGNKILVKIALTLVIYLVNRRYNLISSNRDHMLFFPTLRVIPCQLNQSLHRDHFRFLWDFHHSILSLRYEKPAYFNFLVPIVSNIWIIKVLGDFTLCPVLEKIAFSRPYQSELICI